ncbi:glycosyltransferase [Roseomonas sp. KE2513]|uniref:glycosyltransferase n=1 Tax=Roseomonas sp. KE2513 TaxID=2479202 RepID=UPI0018DF375B|nr:glycosyltransferase [Roseomonas sp. KE2513]MBI0534839.1 glycosyltransferase [Roseomonas sp. KE2513]
MSEAHNTRSGPARGLQRADARGGLTGGRVELPRGRDAAGADGPSGTAPAPGAEAPLVLMLSAAHPPTDLRIVAKEGAALVEAGWRVTHLAPAPQRGAKDVPASQAGVSIATYPRPSGWIGRLRAARALAARAARLKADVIHAHEPDSWYAAIKAAGRTGAAVVLDVHEHYPSRLDGRLPRPLHGLGRWAVRAVCKWMAARADAVVVAKDGLEDAFPDVGIVPVRNYAAAVPVEPREHRPGPLTLVHLGALTRERGSFEMLRALTRCPEGTRLSLIGRFTDGSETDFLSEAKRLGVAGAVERHGWMAHEAAVALAATADIGLVLFQPGHENHRLALPHKLFDCMLAGLPVIVPDFAEEVAAVVRETGCGMLVDTADPATVADAVRALADPALRAEMGAAGRAAALGRFGWAGEAARLVELYQDLVPLPAGLGSESGLSAAPAGAVREAPPELEAAPRPVAGRGHAPVVQQKPAPVAQRQPVPVVREQPVPVVRSPPAPVMQAPAAGPTGMVAANLVATRAAPLPLARPQAPSPLDPTEAFASLSAAMRAAPPLAPEPPVPAAPLPPATGSGDAFASAAAPLPVDRRTLAAPQPADVAGAFASLSAAMRAASPRPPAASRIGAGAGTPASPAVPRLLLDAALNETEAMPATFAALLAREAPERPPRPENLPPSQVLGPLPAPAPPAPSPARPTPAAVLGSVVRAIRTAGAPVPAPVPVPPVPGAAAPFPLLAAVGGAIQAPPPPPASSRPVFPPRLAPSQPALTGRPIEVPPAVQGERLLAEAGLSGAVVPASVAAVLARQAGPQGLPEAGPILTSDVPLIEAGLRAAGPVRADPETPGWRLLQAAPPPAAAPVADAGR